MFCRARKQTEFEKRKAAFAKLLGLLLSMMKRRALYDVLPLDPTAWPVLLAAHREELRNTMAEQAAVNKVDLSTMQAPGAQASSIHGFHVTCQPLLAVAWSSCEKMLLEVMLNLRRLPPSQAQVLC